MTYEDERRELAESGECAHCDERAIGIVTVPGPTAGMPFCDHHRPLDVNEQAGVGARPVALH